MSHDAETKTFRLRLVSASPEQIAEALEAVRVVLTDFEIEHELDEPVLQRPPSSYERCCLIWKMHDDALANKINGGAGYSPSVISQKLGISRSSVSNVLNARKGVIPEIVSLFHATQGTDPTYTQMLSMAYHWSTDQQRKFLRRAISKLPKTVGEALPVSREIGQWKRGVLRWSVATDAAVSGEHYELLYFLDHVTVLFVSGKTRNEIGTYDTIGTAKYGAWLHSMSEEKSMLPRTVECDDGLLLDPSPSRRTFTGRVNQENNTSPPKKTFAKFDVEDIEVQGSNVVLHMTREPSPKRSYCVSHETTLNRWVGLVFASCDGPFERFEAETLQEARAKIRNVYADAVPHRAFHCKKFHGRCGFAVDGPLPAVFG